IIVNASPVGMHPNIDKVPLIPFEFITDNHVVFDTIYNPAETMLMKLSAEKGATVKNGLEMLEGQAIAAWKIWNDKQ
ncbi:MAG: shikimate dehydrogenase, partial [Muribaculaceae bacterium]|nr:shikimate dehydrogenase [Muribaculaceae bacterium]